MLQLVQLRAADSGYQSLDHSVASNAGTRHQAAAITITKYMSEMES